MPPFQPAWGSARAVMEPEPRKEVRKPRGLSKPEKGQVSLFEQAEEAAAGDPWVDKLLTSPVYTAQRHCRMTQQALALALGQPEFRVRSMVVGLQRLLNVDGYPIVSLDDASQTVMLDRGLLMKQFQIS